MRTLYLIRSGLLSLALAVFSTNALASTLDFNDIYVFGDSLSDTGNTASIAGTSPPINNLGGYGSNNRFSNGLVWHEYLAGDLGLSAASHSRSGGTNYAFGGARVDDVSTGPSRGVIYQQNQYLAGPGANGSDSEALYIAWAGGNDMRDQVGNADPVAAIQARLDTFKGVLGNLLSNGLQTLLVPNLPDLGSIPEFAGSANGSVSGTEVSTLWNEGLGEVLVDLSSQYSADIYALDVFTIFDDILKDPASSGFTNTTDECRSLDGFIENECANSDQFVFWDEIHPTTAAHQALGVEAYNLLASGNAVRTVPEPATLFLLAVGLAGLGWRRGCAER